MKSQTKTRKGLLFLIAGILLLALIGAAGATYAYWAGTVSAPADLTKTDNSVVVTGSGKDTTTQQEATITLNNTNIVLVPTGKISETNVDGGKTAVESFTYTYKVTWSQLAGSAITSADNIKGNLTVQTTATVGDGSSTDANQLVNVSNSINSGAEIVAQDATGVTVTFIVTLTEPSTKALYDLVANKAINVVHVFRIALQ